MSVCLSVCPSVCRSLSVLLLSAGHPGGRYGNILAPIDHELLPLTNVARLSLRSRRTCHAHVIYQLLPHGGAAPPLNYREPNLDYSPNY